MGIWIVKINGGFRRTFFLYLRYPFIVSMFLGGISFQLYLSSPRSPILPVPIVVVFSHLSTPDYYLSRHSFLSWSVTGSEPWKCKLRVGVLLFVRPTHRICSCGWVFFFSSPPCPHLSVTLAHNRLNKNPHSPHWHLPNTIICVFEVSHH